MKDGVLADQFSSEVTGLLTELNAPFSKKVASVQSLSDIFLCCESLE
jgi:hypothetical protein